MTDEERRALQGRVFRRKTCHACGAARQPRQELAKDKPDACLGMLPGVRGACCGHGHSALCYVYLADGRRLDGPEAAAELVRLGGRPAPLS